MQYFTFKLKHWTIVIQKGNIYPCSCCIIDIKTETNAGGILAFQTRVGTTTQERKRVNNATRTRICIILLNYSSSML